MEERHILVWANRVPRRKLVEVAWQGGCVNGAAGRASGPLPRRRPLRRRCLGAPMDREFRGATAKCARNLEGELFRAPAGWVAVGRRVEECDFR